MNFRLFNRFLKTTNKKNDCVQNSDRLRENVKRRLVFEESDKEVVDKNDDNDENDENYIFKDLTKFCEQQN